MSRRPTGSPGADQVTAKKEAVGGPLPAELSDLGGTLELLGANLAFADAGAGTEFRLTLPSGSSENR